MPNATLLPPNATPLERTAAGIGMRVDVLPVPLREIWDPASAPGAVLPWLAWAFGVEDWSPDWPEAQRRAVVDASIPIKQHRGTIGAVRQAIAPLGIAARVQEWFNQVPAGQPYTYRLLLEVEDYGYTRQQLARMLTLVERNKNLRSHLDTIQPSVTARSGPYAIAISTAGHDVAVQDGTPRYDDGGAAVDLLIDAATNGTASTIFALDALDYLVRVAMPANDWASP